ncbi:MAG TPA: FAD-dependent oxidoreductase [Janthinobacterium sp.]|nr:FAD-dependent oxidoreductase [Janthinobacterium sp.]
MKPGAGKPALVVVGNGMAGMRTVEELHKLAPELYDITVFGAEPHGNYNRILLSPLLAGEKSVDDIMLHTRDWYRRHGIVLHAGDPVEHIDRRRRIVRSRSGIEAHYDRLLLATGSTPFILPVPGHQLDGVIAFRDLQDVATMLEAAQNHRHAVVIGGGLLGLEAANGLRRQGMEVTVLHVTDSLMNQQLDKPAAALLRQALEGQGLRFVLNAQTAEIAGPGRVTAVRYREGGAGKDAAQDAVTEIPADLVVMAAGVRPNIALAQRAGLHCERAIVVDDTLQSYDPRIYAVGECVQHRSATFGLVAPIWEQARVCGAHLAGAGHRRYVQQASPTRLKVSGVDLYSVGDFIGGPDSEDLVLRDPRRGVYKRLVLQGNRLAGAVLYGDVQDGPWYFDLIQRGSDIGALRQHLLFGRATSGRATSGRATSGQALCGLAA